MAFQQTTVFNTSLLRGELVLHDFCKLVKKIIWNTGFRFVSLDSPTFVGSVTLFMFLQGV
jgi:hypothetical protein